MLEFSVRLSNPTFGTVLFDEVEAASEADALARAEADYPGFIAEYASLLIGYENGGPPQQQQGSRGIMARFEEDFGTTTLKEGDLSPATGWTVHGGSVNRIGPMNFIHLEVSCSSGAPGLVITVPDDLKPTEDLHTSDAKFTLSSSDGTLTFTGDTVASAGDLIVCELVYDGRKAG